MNFIKHYRAWREFAYSDRRLTAHHTTLYFALFDIWNSRRFQNPIAITRYETMRRAQIGSPKTYLRCLKELTEWGYIRYEPSFDPQRTSVVYLFPFDTGDKQTGEPNEDTNEHTDKYKSVPYGGPTGEHVVT